MQSIRKNKKVLIGIATALAAVLLVLILILLLAKCAPGEPAAPAKPTVPGATDPTGEATEPPTEPAEKEPDTHTKLLDAMDEVGSWIGSSPAVCTDEEHTFLGSAARDEQGSVVFSRAFDPAEDMRGYAKGYLRLWIYVEDLSKMSGGQVELSSSGNPDNRELSWDLMLYLTRSGWNKLDLPFANANRVGGEIDLKNVNFMRIYGIVEENCTFGVDEIVLTNEEPEKPSRLDGKGQYVLDEVESLGAWIGTSPYLASKDPPVGKGYVYTDQRDGDALVLSRSFEPMDLTAFKNGYLHLWIYVRDLSALSGGQIELSSAGTADVSETAWDLMAYVKKSGWNEVYLPVSQALLTDGGADFSAVNFIRVFALSCGNNALGVDYVCMSNTAPPAPSRMDANNQYVIDQVEALETWVGSDVYLSRSDPAVGSACLMTQSVDEAGSAVFTRLLPNLDAYAYRNGYLHLWLYIENVDLVTGGQIELSSAGMPDVEETSWNIGGIELKNGWNDIYLPVSEATKVGGGANFGKLDFIRIYIMTSQPQKIGIDYIALSRVAPEREDPVDENGDYIIDLVQGISPWSGSALVYNTANGYAEGRDWLSASSSAAQDMVFFRNFAAADLSAYRDGYLHLWIYVDKIANVTGGMVEITSSGSVDDGELYWPLASYLTRSGWNELYLPFRSAIPEGANAADITKMNCIRVVVMLGGDGGNVGIDEIYATNSEPPVQEPEYDGIIDPVTSAQNWEGSALTYHKNGGYIPAADYLSASATGAGDLVFARLFPNADASAFAEGGLQLWVYVDQKAHLTGGMIEITSAGTVDEQELWWPIADYVTKDGWNLVYLPFANAQKQGSQAADMTALNYIRVVMSMGPEGGTGGIDELRFVKAAPGTEKIIIHSGETLNATWGEGLMLADTGAPVGSKYIQTGSAPSAVVCANIIPAVDIRGYERTGEVHGWIYVEDLSKLIDGQLELTSSGLSDDQEISWNLTPEMLQNGWNELTLKFADAYLVGTPNFAAINYMRIYMNFKEAASFGMDEIYVGGVKADITQPGDDTSMEEAVEAAKERSVLYAGSDQMKAAIAAVLAKAKKGEAVTLVTLGDSITAGAVAPVGQEWASLVRTYLEGLDGNAENGNVTLVNAGIGSTEAVFGVSRVEKDVLSKSPDLVIVDFGTNDYGLPYGAEAYEGILCKLIGAGVPVINSNVCPRNGNNIQTMQQPINEVYGVPQISFRTAYYELSATTTIVGLRANDIWSSDNVHPTAAGHKLLADLLIDYLNTHILEAGVEAGAMETELPQCVTNNGFADAILVENFTSSDQVQVTMDGWSGDYAARIYQLSTEGWQTNAVGSSITFRVHAGYFYMFFELNPNCGDLEIAVDGTVKETINWAYLGTGYMNPHHIVHLGQPGEHTVTITLRDNANVEHDWAGICAVGAANFSGYSQTEEPDGTIDMVTGEYPWGGSYETTGGYAEGAGWQKSALSAAGDLVFYCFKSTPKDLSFFSDGYLHMWLYVDKAANLRPYAGMIEISSAGSVDNEELYWELHTLGLKDGWNELYLPISSALPQGDGAFDISRFNTMRVVVMFNENGGTAGIDEIYMTGEKPTQVPDTMVISEVEEQNGWDSVNGITVSSENPAVGSNWVKTVNPDFWPSIAWWCPAMDISPYAQSGYLHMWLYIPKAADVVGGEIELTSSGTADSGEAAWPLISLNLKDGWNELYLPFAEAVKTDGSAGPVNYEAINFIRIFAGITTPDCIGIDKMEVTMTKPEVPVEPAGTIDMVTGEYPWGGSYETTGGYTEGAGWQKSALSTTGDLVFYCFKSMPKDLSFFSNGYLHMWLYVDKTANLRPYAGMIEISSAGSVDNEELYWELHTLGLQDGWNELYLPISSALTQGDGAFDISRFNTMRVVVMFNENGGTAGIDEIYMTGEKPAQASDAPAELAAIHGIRIHDGFAAPDRLGLRRKKTITTKP